jgi:branched-chain amino acid transport system ATP-binding protein
MTLLQAEKLTAGYGSLAAVRDLDLHVEPGEVVLLLGANGAGKTTTLLALAGDLPLMGGTVRWRGEATTAPLHVRARQGLGLVTEERSVFMGLSASANLRLGRGDPAEAVALFPELETHLDRRAGLLSGGQQQMLTLARALAGKPAALLADELSLGLAPIIVQRLLKAVRAAADSGVGVLLVEQHARAALKIADRAYVLHHGQCVLSGPAAEFRADMSKVEAAYLGG